MTPFPGQIQRYGIGGKIHLTTEQEAWFRQTFPVTTDMEIAAAMGVAKTSVWRLSIALDAHKDIAYLTSMLSDKRSAALRVVASRPKTAEHKRRISEAKRAQRKRDRIRVAAGLKPLTRYRMPSQAYTIAQVRARYNAVTRYNYLLDTPAPATGKARYTIYYDEQTERSARFERFHSQHNGFIFQPA